MRKGVDATVEEVQPASGPLFPRPPSKKCSAVKAILAHPDCAVAVPALPESAKRLLEMPEKGRRDARMLALLAQKDPIFLARLLCMACGPDRRRAGVHATTAEEAIAAVGAPAALAALLEIAEASPTSLPMESIGTPLCLSRQFVLRRCLPYSLTAQKLARYLELDEECGSMLHLACLLDSLGLYAGIHSGHEAAVDIRQGLLEKAASSGHALGDCEAVEDYHLLSASLAAKWNADGRVVAMLTPGGGPMRALLVAVERMVDAKVKGGQQQRALAEAVAGHPRWEARVRKEDIYLAVLPW